MILKNRKVMGDLLPHRVRQGGSRKPAGPLIQEMTPPMLTPSLQPKYRIRREPPQAEPPEYLVAEFFLKDLVCWRDIDVYTVWSLLRTFCTHGQTQVKMQKGSHCMWLSCHSRLMYPHNEHVFDGWSSFFKSQLDCRQCKILSIYCQHKSYSSNLT